MNTTRKILIKNTTCPLRAKDMCERGWKLCFTIPNPKGGKATYRLELEPK